MATPLCLSPAGSDMFRLPKQLALYATVLAATMLFVTATLLGRDFPLRAAWPRLRGPIFLCVTGLLWASVSALFSTNRALSGPALLWAASLALLVLLAVYSLPSMPLRWIQAAVFAPALVNATVLYLQAFSIWNPWSFPERTPVRMFKNALLGNPDDVGMYLAAPALLACLLAMRRGPLQIVSIGLAVYLTGAVLVTETQTAIIALACALLLLVVRRDVKAGIASMTAVTVALVVLVAFYEPIHRRAIYTYDAIRTGNWNVAVSGRLPAFAAAWTMFRERPIVGVGPGCFKFNFFAYRLKAEETYESLPLVRGRYAVNFGETHNDHLQLLAEVGLPGYGVALAGLALVALPGLRRRPGALTATSEIATALSLPLTVLVAIMMLAQFPWQIAASAYVYALLGAACVAWNRVDAS